MVKSLSLAEGLSYFDVSLENQGAGCLSSRLGNKCGCVVRSLFPSHMVLGSVLLHGTFGKCLLHSSGLTKAL